MSTPTLGGHPTHRVQDPASWCLQEDKRIYLLATHPYECRNFASLELQGLGKEKIEEKEA